MTSRFSRIENGKNQNFNPEETQKTQSVKGSSSLSQPMSKKAISCCPTPSATYSTLVFRNRPGQSEPILIGGEKMLKPALRLMSDYRLRIEEIKGAEVVTSYTRWLASVETIGS
jgi:hypothetical protein